MAFFIPSHQGRGVKKQRKTNCRKKQAERNRGKKLFFLQSPSKKSNCVQVIFLQVFFLRFGAFSCLGLFKNIHKNIGQKIAISRQKRLIDLPWVFGPGGHRGGGESAGPIFFCESPLIHI
jgi:hypothetical protein